MSRRRSSGLQKRLPSDCCRRYGGVDERSGVLALYSVSVIISNTLELNTLLFSETVACLVKVLGG